MKLTGLILAEDQVPRGALALALGSEAPSMPMPIIEEETATHRWLRKPVHEFVVLDDMEPADHWTHRGHGRMEFTRDRAKAGIGSLRLISPTRGEKPGRVAGRPFGEAAARREFGGADWRGYNRISFWVYPELPGFQVISLLVKLHNDGLIQVPDSYHREGLHYVLLEADRWNQVVWEIPHLARDRVTALEFIYRLQGNEPGATETVQYDIDRVELQRVDADLYEGWGVAPGRIAYSHSGYAPDARKTALVTDMEIREFVVRRMTDGQVAFTGRLRAQDTAVGRMQVLDFSHVTVPGDYRLEVGSLITPPFRIGTDVWRESIWKTIHHFYCQRCGDAIPGIHDVCHQDWRAVHEEQTIFIHGGWHDAGDLLQGLVNTAEAVYALLDLADTLAESDPVLSARLMEEANWGLDWVLKTRFDDGSRVTWATMDFWTDGVVGTVDDVFGQVRNHPFDNSVAAIAQARAAQVLRHANTERADRSLDQARRQLEWHVGRNPFAPSLMYGEGHDYAPQYTAMSGDIVGSLPVGVQTRENLDLPYWPASNCYNWKEVWVHPSSRWLSILSDLLDPALVETPTVPGLDQFEVRLRRARGDLVEIEARLRGDGIHRVSLRVDNLVVNEPDRVIDLGRGRTRRVIWSTRVLATREPWVAVVVPNGVLEARQEINGF